MKTLLMKKVLLVFFIMGSILHSYGQKAKPASGKESEILQRNREMEKAFMENDFEEVAAFYSDSATLVADRQEITGKKAVSDYWNSLKGKGISWQLENIHTEVHGDVAIQRGISRLKMWHNGREAASDVRFTLFWKKINGKWLIEIDHYSMM